MNRWVSREHAMLMIGAITTERSTTIHNTVLTALSLMTDRASRAPQKAVTVEKCVFTVERMTMVSTMDTAATTTSSVEWRKLLFSCKMINPIPTVMDMSKQTRKGQIPRTSATWISE
jgi:hypothetical protein